MNPIKKKPRILYVTTAWPYRSIRALNIAMALRSVGELEIVLVHSEGDNWGSNDLMVRDFKIACEFHVQPRVKEGAMARLKRVMDARAPFPHGVGVDDQATAKVVELAKEFDMVWFFKWRNANMFNHWSWPRSVIDIDDLPSGVFRAVGQTGKTTGQKLAARWQRFQWQRRERLLGERGTVFAVCSEQDRQSVQISAPVHVIPNGFPTPAQVPSRTPISPPRLGFIGLFDYFPNYDGMQWFIRECWPLVQKEVPGIRLRLVGRASDGPIKTLGSDIDGLGWVNDATEEIASWSGMIVPLHVGGGQRVKIPEGFSRKCPIVSTSLGAFGFDVQNGRELHLADTPQAFAGACVSLIRDPSGGAAMAERAYEAFLKKWTWDAIAPKIWATAEDCLRLSGSPRS